MCCRVIADSFSFVVGEMKIRGHNDVFPLPSNNNEIITSRFPILGGGGGLALRFGREELDFDRRQSSEQSASLSTIISSKPWAVD